MPHKPHVTVLGPDQIGAIHAATLSVLQHTGVDVLEGEALELLRAAGAEVSGNRARIPAALIDAALSTAPNRYWLHDRLGNPAIELGSLESYFGTGSDCPNTTDLETGERRLGRKDDVARAARLADALPNIHFVMSYALASDAPGNTFYLHQFEAMVSNTAKPIVYVCDDLRDIRDIVAMAEVVAGGEAALAEKPFLVLYAEPTTPLRHSESALQKVLFLAQKGLPVIYAPGIGAGGTTPLTGAGSLVVGNAEILSGLVIHQLKRPGAPFVYGGGFSILDMRTSVVSYAAPEFQLRNAAMTEMAQHYGLPTFSFAGSTDSKVADIQAGVEIGTFSLISALSGANLLHDVGYLESGLTGALELIVLGDEVAGLVRAIARGLSTDADALAVDVIAAVGPGGNYLSEEHTVAHLRADTWFPTILDRQRYDAWDAGGRTSALEVARAKARRLLARHQPAPLPAGVAEKLSAIVEGAWVARRRRSQGAERG